METVSIHNGHERINRWASDNTNGKIKNVVGSLNPLTILVLNNAIYFNGTWATPFDPEDTRPHEFARFQDAEVVLAKAFVDYNKDRIHSALGYLTPNEFVLKLEGGNK